MVEMNQIWINKCGHVHAYHSARFGGPVRIDHDNVCFRCRGLLANETGTADVVRSWLGAK